ncbi:hypothetical protein NDU88_005800 [Pleurodeles waltl]|uniref:Uncharacterized protein n=1 Tax=Pleurodeles waltl TaxID=8319 RepID=A0AAV7PLH0_PLEWA|nr:hypothetical protein NDU88_005800 [Pleurodeles waltl]
MPPSPHMSQRTVPMKDNSEHRVNQLKGQRPPEKIYLACHRQGRLDPGGLPQTEHPLPEKMGGHSPLEQEDDGGSAGDGLPTSRTSTSATTSTGPVVPVVTGIWSAPVTRAASVGRSHSTDSLPPVKHQKLASARRERGKTPATKAAPRGTGGSVESAATHSKVGKGHKKVSKSGKSSTAEKTAIIPAAQEATAIIPTAQDATAIIPAAQEATVIIPAAQEATASTSPAAQEATASSGPAAQEATASTSPAAQEATTSKSPAGP